jgi:hypothetical protein
MSSPDRDLWPLSPEIPIYAQVDSFGDATYGAVVENHEILDWLYNNIVGPVYPDVGAAASGPSAGGPAPREEFTGGLPRRP